MMRLLFLTVMSGTCALAADCATVTGEHISGRDLKAASNRFALLDDDVMVALSPAPGVRRVLTPQFLARLGSTDSEICFQLAADPVSKASMLTAMKAAFGSREISVQIIDDSRTVSPPGQVDFPLSGLGRPPVNSPSAPVLWRGRVRLNDHSSVAVWALVRLEERRQWVESVEQLVAGQPVTLGQLRTQSGARFPLLPISEIDVNRFAGRSPRRTTPAGQPLSPQLFVDPPTVGKGDIVQVQVLSGGVSLQFEGRAETSGRLNDSILVFDPRQGRRLKAQVNGKGKVIIHAHPSNPAARGTSGSGIGAGSGA